MSFHSSIISGGFLSRTRIDLNDYPDIYNTERHSILSLNKERVIVSSPPDKSMPDHRSSVLSF